NSAVVPKKGLPLPLELAMEVAVRALQNTIILLRLEDQTPSRPVDGAVWPWQAAHGDPESANHCEWVDPELVTLPDPATVAPDDPHYWWMRLRCPWGSRHTRLLGDTAPD